MNAGWSCQHGRHDTGLRRLVLTVTAGFVLTGSAAAATDAAGGDPPLRIGRITIESTSVYTPEEVEAVGGAENVVRRTMNGLHVTTRETVIRHELLFAEGDLYDPSVLDETERNLRSLGILNGVVIAATDTTADGSVHVVVRTRDSWTLSASLGFSIASSGDTRWNVRLAENNFLGYGVTVGGGVGQDEDRAYWNLWYRQRRLFGTGLWLGLDYSEQADGHNYGVTLAQPFYAFDDPWSLHTQAWDTKADVRTYLSNAGPAGEDPSRAASLYSRIPREQKGVLVTHLRRLGAPGGDRVWRGGIGFRYLDTRYQPGAAAELSDGRVSDLRWLAEGDEPMARDTGHEVYPHLSLQTEGRRWTKGRFVLQYGPVEDIPLHAAAALTVGPSGGQVGSTANFGRTAWRGDLNATLWRPVGGGLLLVRLDGSGTAGSREVRKHAASALAGWIVGKGSGNSPWLTRVFAEVAHGSRLNGTAAYLLGLDRGLRTLDFDGMAGDRLVRWNIEQGKVSPREYFGLMRAGLAVFYDGGCAWWRDEDRDLADARHEIGCGLRIGPTRSSNSLVTRLDVSWSLTDSRGPVLTAATRGYF